MGEQYGINAKGEATISSLLLHALQSYNFNGAGNSGAFLLSIGRRMASINSRSPTSLFGAKAIFNELELRRLSYVGGNMVFSAKITKVEDKGSTWRCYFPPRRRHHANAQNLWQTDDLARAETTRRGRDNRHYWRGVTSVGEETG